MHILKKFEALNKYARLSIIIIIMGVILRFALIFLYHPSGDACWHLSIARFMADNLKIPLLEPLGREVFWEPPVFHMIAATFYKIFSIFGLKAADFGMKLVSPVFGSLSLILTFMVIDNFFGKRIAFYSIIFATFLPINIFYGTIPYTESAMAFFVLLAVYLIMKKRYILSSITFSIALLSKYNAVFSFPLIMYFMYKDNKARREFLQKFFIFCVIVILIFLPWIIRNYIALGNPLWPFFSSIFGGYTSPETFQGNNIASLSKVNNLVTIYLGIFGVPEGAYQNIFFFDVPFIRVLFGIWLAATLLFLVPIFLYCKRKDALSKVNTLILIWIAPHLLLIALYIINTSIAYSRLLMPVVPLLSAIWGLGFSSVVDKLRKFKTPIFFILIILIIGFVAGEFIKTTLASRAWNFYEKDFSWVKRNTNKDAAFMGGGQCLSYNLDRFTLYPTKNNINKVDYILVNQNFKIDKQLVLDDKTLKSIEAKNFKIVYYNKDTGTTVYGTKQYSQPTK